MGIIVSSLLQLFSSFFFLLVSIHTVCVSMRCMHAVFLLVIVFEGIFAIAVVVRNVFSFSRGISRERVSQCI